MNAVHAHTPDQDPVLDAPRAAMDAFGYACLTVSQADGRCLWRSALARRLMADYFIGGHFERGFLPPELLLWLHREALRRRAGAPALGLTVLPQTPNPYNPSLPNLSKQPGRRSSLGREAKHLNKRLSFRLHEADAEALGDGQWLIVLSDE